MRAALLRLFLCLLIVTVSACKRSSHPDLERVKADLIGQSIGGDLACTWTFRSLQEIADISLANESETRDLLTVAVDLRMRDDITGRLAHGRASLVYRRSDASSAWQFAAVSGPCVMDSKGHAVAVADAGTNQLPTTPSNPLAPLRALVGGGSTLDDSPMIPVGTSPVRGDPNAPVTIVVFSDFQCPFCSRLETTLQALEVRWGKAVRIVWKNNPLSFHANARPAALAAMAAHQQGKFWEYHDLLFANQNALQPSDLEAYASRLGLNLARFRTDMLSSADVMNDTALASRLGANATPVSFIDGEVLRGAQPQSSFDAIIVRHLSEAATITPARTTYATLVARHYLAAPTPAPSRYSPPPKSYANVADVGPWRGSATPLVTIVAFSDFQCPFCRRASATIDTVLARHPEVRVVFRHNPLAFHTSAEGAAEASMEVFAQMGNAGFWRFHDTLFANQTALGPSDLEAYAKAQGANSARVVTAIRSSTHRALIARDQADALAVGATGTPSFYINGFPLVGAQPETEFERVIAIERARAEAALRAGIPRAGLYGYLVSHPPASP